MKTPYKTEIVRSTFGLGWGNGYVTVPEGHPYYGKCYTEVPVEVHGGLTYSAKADSGWEFGFDTQHSSDTITSWPEERVRAETERLREQLEQLARPMTATEVLHRRQERLIPTQFYSVLAPGTKIEKTDIYCLPLERWLRPVEVKLAMKEEQP